MDDRGFTLVEVIVAVLLTGVIVSSVYSVALSSRRGGGKADRRLLGAQASKAVAATLRNYVTADSNLVPGGALTIHGPNVLNPTGVTQWSLHTPGPPAIQTDSLGSVWALATGTHRIECPAAVGSDGPCFLPRILRTAPFNGYIEYTVAAGSPPQVTINVVWTEP